ncbi:MAG TPA: BCAM0308 family protein [Candidatus Accumulibacter phosphatis]|nr:MAG: hypothetical protein AW07_03681 [Candidatus Accumulibacter sp. SK-11]HAY27356.1 ATPase [Accumulibacter sp.]HRL75288.1 BCAM0308 family protein [Candidatus Accumulibacter phosphatis]HCN70063.1 ATPase [Accumulibacter sp.]HCV13541.1 ATPase [Accumulibacter sp.]
MSSKSIPAGFQQVRRDRLLQEEAHDSYRSKGKLAEPTVCPKCHAVYSRGRWQWGIAAPADAHQVTCPACHRVSDHCPAGHVVLAGDFLQAHHDDIVHLVRNEAERQRAEHPLKRVMAFDDGEGELRLSTTDIHLARAIGEAVHHAYQGTLEFHYNPQELLLHVHWSR